MPAYNFKPRFAQYILSDEKGSTIRARRKDGLDPKPGDTMYLYTGMRTKACRLLKTTPCLRVTPIRITRRNIFLRGHRVEGTDLFRLCVNDGFGAAAALHHFFLTTHGADFRGFLIEWRPTNFSFLPWNSTAQ
jgi:hypothetical protein